MNTLILNARILSGVRISPTSDNRRICLSAHYYRFIFQKDHSLMLSETLEVSYIIDPINKAKVAEILPSLIILSDHSSQYVAKKYKKHLKICSVVTQRNHFHGIIHALNLSILLSNMNGLISLKFAITCRHTD